MSTVAGLLSQSKYSHNIIRTGDIDKSAPHTVLKSLSGTTVVLPLPTTLTSNMSMDWQQENVGIIKEMIMHNKADLNNLLSSTSYKDSIQKLDVRAAKAITDASEDFKQIMARGKMKSKLGGGKFVKNPRLEMMFTGVQFRSFSLPFTLVPYTKKDSDSITQAIKEIQKASVPKIAFERMFMIYPDTWTIKFMSGEKEGNKYLMKINECCCTGVNINYNTNADGNMHEDNAPISVELTLDFTEIFIPSKDNIEEYYG